jgi:hypothetical protein
MSSSAAKGSPCSLWRRGVGHREPYGVCGYGILLALCVSVRRDVVTRRSPHGSISRESFSSWHHPAGIVSAEEAAPALVLTRRRQDRLRGQTALSGPLGTHLAPVPYNTSNSVGLASSLKAFIKPRAAYHTPLSGYLLTLPLCTEGFAIHRNYGPAVRGLGAIPFLSHPREMRAIGPARPEEATLSSGVPPRLLAPCAHVTAGEEPAVALTDSWYQAPLPS